MKDDVDITIVCPISVDTNLRDNALVMMHATKAQEEAAKDPTKKKTLSIEQAAKFIMMAADTRMRKVFFPEKAWYSNYLRPFAPDFIDKKLLSLARL